MTIIRSWSGDGVATGPLTTASAGSGDTAFTTVGSGLTVDPGGIRPPCISVADGTGPAQATWSSLSSANWAIRQYVKVGSATGLVLNAHAGTNTIAQADFNGSGNFRFSSTVAGAKKIVWVAAATFPTSSWTRVEATYVGSTGALQVAYYAGDGTTAIDSTSTTVDTGLTLTDAVFGRYGGTTAGLYVDDIAVADQASMIGPAAAAVVPNSYLFNGSLWVASKRSLIG